VFDWHRRFYKYPFIIKDVPKLTKYYERAPVTKTQYFNDFELKERNEMVTLLQNHYYPSDRVFCSIQLPEFEALNKDALITVYYNQKSNVIDGFISSHTMNISVECSPKVPEERLIVLESVEYIDTICFNHLLATPKKTRSLLATHEYNQRHVRTSNKITLFKKEVDLIDALVPLVKYDTYTFYMRPYKVSHLPVNWQLIRIQREHVNHLHDFMSKVASLKDPAGFQVSLTMEIGYLMSLLETNQYFVYALRGPDTESAKKLDAVYALYIFRNAFMKYDDLDGADTIHFISAFRNTNDSELFLKGFIWALREVKKEMTESKMIMFDDIGHIRPLVNKWKQSHDIILQTPCAYYLTNYIVPMSPFLPENTFILS
jgi:hypothetical protein